MAWHHTLSPQQRAALDAWLETVLHDLVKYLELMPRNLDWDALEEDDLDLLYEAIFETRVDRHGTRSARQVWQGCLDALPESLAALPTRDPVETHLDLLEAHRTTLERGDLEALDVQALRGALFGIGELLRGLR